MTDPLSASYSPPFEDDLVQTLLSFHESQALEIKRVGDNRRKLETIVAMANSEGGVLLLGVEDERKATGRDRVYGIEENLESVDELQRLLVNRITAPLAPPACEAPRFLRFGCTLRDGSHGSVVLVQVAKSATVHSVVDGGTYVRYLSSNRQISATEITELSMRRGATSVVNSLVDVSFELLNTAHWREYAAHRRLTRPLPDAMRHVGLARDDDGALRPTRAAVLLFAEDPGGLLDAKCSVRLFHYRGEKIERTAAPNLVRPPQTIGGPLHLQIAETRNAVLRELSSGVQVGPLGFDIAQRYPVRVIQEAITNAVIHRDYHISADIHIRIFADRIEVESPGVLPGNLTTATLGVIGSRPRNRALVDHLRDFPVAPNLDAGEGVPMMRATMIAAELYPPVFQTGTDFPREAVLLQLSNEARPSIWTQVEAHLNKHGDIGNAEIRTLLQTDDPVRASRSLKTWVDLGLLIVANPDKPKQFRRYRPPVSSPAETLFSKVQEKAGR